MRQSLETASDWSEDPGTFESGCRCDKQKVRRALATSMRVGGQSVRTHVLCDRGKIDIVTREVAVQVGHASRWRETSGIAMICSGELGLRAGIALYGDADYMDILRHCTELNVVCQCFPKEGGHLKALLEVEVCSALTNDKALARKRRQPRQ